MMYVSDRSADSICPTWPELRVMKPSYVLTHEVGDVRTLMTDGDAAAGGEDDADVIENSES
jgi:hypothetical protein